MGTGTRKLGSKTVSLPVLTGIPLHSRQNTPISWFPELTQFWRTVAKSWFAGSFSLAIVDCSGSAIILSIVSDSGLRSTCPAWRGIPRGAWTGLGELFCVACSGEESGLSVLFAEELEEAGRPAGEVCSCADILKVYCPSKLLREGSEGSEPRCICAAGERTLQQIPIGGKMTTEGKKSWQDQGFLVCGVSSLLRVRQNALHALRWARDDLEGKGSNIATLRRIFRDRTGGWLGMRLE
jgi:hypothetical protein